MKTLIIAAAAAVFSMSIGRAAVAETASPDVPATISFQWDVKIPLRDGVRLSGILYRPRNQTAPTPCIFSLDPYIAQGAHSYGVYFAMHGLPFLAVDSRGRGNSEGVFRPFIQEARDGYDVVEWLARQPYCNGKVSIWGNSYRGSVQWATAKELPPHLATIMPIAAAYPGVDFAMRNNIPTPYNLQWLTFTSGHAAQGAIFSDLEFWAAKYREWFESGIPFADMDRALGNPSAVFQEWVSHPVLDSYWDAYVPTAQQYARLRMPILTVTGSHDGDQAGALTYYREHLRNASQEEQARHYLVIGPWDHGGTVAPRAEFGGLHVGPASLIDVPRLALDWYAWTMSDGPKPEFLKKRVAYYVIGADKWRYADTLEAVTGESQPYFLDSTANANDVLASGSLERGVSGRGAADRYVYDPRDTRGARPEAAASPPSLTQQRSVYMATGKALVYHSAAFEQDAEISGFFKLSVWIAIDCPDTDFDVSIYVIDANGGSVLLTADRLRARYRESLREPKLIETRKPLRYDFAHFAFVSQRIEKGSRLRLTIGPIDSIMAQKNYNSGGVVAEESMQDARPVTVTLYHDRAHPSALYVPIGQPDFAN
jgi:putative CocE/NonD family hydrolase